MCFVTIAKALSVHGERLFTVVIVLVFIFGVGYTCSVECWCLLEGESGPNRDSIIEKISCCALLHWDFYWEYKNSPYF